MADNIIDLDYKDVTDNYDLSSKNVKKRYTRFKKVDTPESTTQQCIENIKELMNSLADKCIPRV